MDNEIQTFPKNEYEALAMLYLQNQDLSGLTPTELLARYRKVLAELMS